MKMFRKVGFNVEHNKWEHTEWVCMFAFDMDFLSRLVECWNIQCSDWYLEYKVV